MKIKCFKCKMSLKLGKLIKNSEVTNRKELICPGCNTVIGKIQ